MNRLWKLTTPSEDGEAMPESATLRGKPISSEPAEGNGPDLDRFWFAVYTTCRHEKHVALHLQQRAIEFYLPLYRAQRRWKDRSLVTLSLPLFPSYIFVRIGRDERTGVLQVPGVLSIVGSNWPRITPLPQFEIEALRNGLDPSRAEPHPLLLNGEKVRICKGPLAGLEGIVVRKKNQYRVVLTLDLIMHSISVEVETRDLEPIFPEMECAGRTTALQSEASLA